MRNVLRAGIVVVVLSSAACSGQSQSNNGASSGGTGSGVAGSSSGAAAGASGSGTAASGNGAAGHPTGPVGFCVLGAYSCPCDSSGLCGDGLVCTNGTCCDAATGDCTSSSSGTAGGGNSSGSGGSTSSGGGTSSGGSTGGGAAGGASACTPGVFGPVITDCGYPYASSNPLTSIDFNESEVLRAILPSGGAPLASVRLFYNDEHALTLGVRSVVVGSSTTSYPVSELLGIPGVQRSPKTGTNILIGDQSGLDPSGRPMWPSLFVTDTTLNPDDRSGDWQQGGTPWNPNAVFGTWKGAVRTVGAVTTGGGMMGGGMMGGGMMGTAGSSGVSITPDADPDKNDWNLGTGADAPPTGLKNEGYGAEVRWDLVLVPGHTYRIQIMVHDGDQNKTGGDVGEACVDFCADQGCPEGSVACSIDNTCGNLEGVSCTNGCCI